MLEYRDGFSISRFASDVERCLTCLVLEQSVASILHEQLNQIIAEPAHCGVEIRVDAAARCDIVWICTMLKELSKQSDAPDAMRVVIVNHDPEDVVGALLTKVGSHPVCKQPGKQLDVVILETLEI